MVENESYEPMFSWGMRMTFAVIIPLFYGLYFGKMHEVMWVIVAAESIGWVELKGSFAQRVRLLLGGALLALVFGFAGSISSAHLWLSIVLMMVVVFIASLFKNLGERGSGLSLTVYVMFIIANAYPTQELHEIGFRCANIAIGGLWSLAVGAFASLFISEQTPYKRSVAFIWKATEGLAAAVAKGWDGKSARSGIREVYLKEKEVNEAVDSSLQLYETRAYQNNHESEHAHQMAQLRKSAYLTSATIMAFHEELDSVNTQLLSSDQKQSIYILLKSIEIICARMTVFTVTGKAEEEILLNSRVLRIHNMCALLKESNINEREQVAIDKIIHFAERLVKLIENSIVHVNSVATDAKVYRTYSLMKTLLILHHKHWIDTVRRLANFNTHSFRYALRSAIIATAAL
ncbi:MAG: hypothetical protein IT256_09410, partial [Chitinophagaceae bacterium]|nr:hypothetical protein [Chitinophagaceae bacterium]